MLAGGFITHLSELCGSWEALDKPDEDDDDRNSSWHADLLPTCVRREYAPRPAPRGPCASRARGQAGNPGLGPEAFVVKPLEDWYATLLKSSLA